MVCFIELKIIIMVNNYKYLNNLIIYNLMNYLIIVCLIINIAMEYFIFKMLHYFIIYFIKMYLKHFVYDNSILY